MASLSLERIVFDSNSGTLNVAVTSLTASDVDIRDLIYTSDSVTAHQGGTWTATVSATDLDIRDLNSATDSVSVVATNLDIRDLAYASDSVTAHQGGGAWLVSDVCSTSVKQSSVTVGATAVALPSSALTGRKRLFVQNRGSVSIYLGASDVATSDGLELSKGSSMIIELGAGVSLYAISTIANQNVRVLEFA